MHLNLNLHLVICVLITKCQSLSSCYYFAECGITVKAFEFTSSPVKDNN